MLIPLFIFEHQLGLPLEGCGMLNLFKRIASDTKHPTASNINKREDERYEHVSRANKAEDVSRGWCSFYEAYSRTKGREQNDDVEIESLNALVGDEREVLPCVVETLFIGDSAHSLSSPNSVIRPYPRVQAVTYPCTKQRT